MILDFAFWTVIAILGVYRVSRMLADEDGPFDLFSWWREKVGQSSWLGRGFHCAYCMSFWLSLLAACTFSDLSLVERLMLWLGIAGAAVVTLRRVG